MVKFRDRSCVADVLIEARHPAINCSLHFDQLYTAVVVSAVNEEWELHSSVGIKINT